MSDTETDADYEPVATRRKNSYKKATPAASSENRARERSTTGKQTRQKEYDNNREMNMSKISEKSIQAAKNLTTKVKHFFGINKQQQVNPYPYQYPFTYQPQQQLIFTPQNQQLLNQYQQLMMFQQATLNQQRTNVEPEPSTESPNEINQNQQDEANLKTINKKKESHVTRIEKLQKDARIETEKRQKIFKSVFIGLSLGEYKDSDLISEIHKHKPNIYVRKSYINENDELVILTTKEEDHEELKKEWANTAFGDGIQLSEMEVDLPKRKLYHCVIRGVRRNLDEQEILGKVEQKYGITKLPNEEIEKTLFCEANTYFKSGMNNILKGGRPHGGIGWIIKKTLKQENKIIFYSERITSLEIGLLTIIGVYMTANGQLNSNMEHKYDINELANLINYLEKNNKCYIVVGDFNSDPNRNKPFDQELKALIKKEGLTCFEEKWNNYSYSYSNGVHYSLIDHVISTSKVVDIIESVEILKPNVLNISDHLPIKTKIKLEIEIVNQSEKKGRKKKQIHRQQINWNDKEIQIKYASLLENEILSQKLIEKLEDSDPINIKSVIDEIINSLHSSMISCSKKVNNNKILCKIKRKSKDWWDEKLEKLHTEMKQQLWIYKQSSYTDSQSKIKYKRLKQDFRNTQRKNLNDHGALSNEKEE
ncbi:hypothetical protein BpHYR1_036397 [Brachionus plicatilis]|uniref:Endonuclease/exonuclease/phosphatase domain-containing protein n=1 Tax=Brachionus plicatilis TaxID=10195 RepID=A0A3M7Q835_BRAPC|nr:hypothetical protein BpHYR1_036397 [Brachionus plicatilis]